MTQIIINPGSGPVKDTTYEDAETNIKHYITDCGLKNMRYIHLAERDEDGRYHFLLFRDGWDRGVHHFVDMPGLPLDKVRYMQQKDQNIWDFPRLYVDGSSWVWCFGMLEDKDFDFEEVE